MDVPLPFEAWERDHGCGWTKCPEAQPRAPCPSSLPSPHPLRSLEKCLLKTTCSQVPCWTLHTHGGTTDPTPAGLAREEGSHGCLCLPQGQLWPPSFSIVLGTCHCHHPIPTSTVEGSRAGPSTDGKQSLGPQGSAWASSWGRSGLGAAAPEDGQPHTHGAPSSSFPSRSPRSSSGNWQLQASSAGGGSTSRSGWVSAGRSWSAGSWGPPPSPLP